MGDPGRHLELTSIKSSFCNGIVTLLPLSIYLTEVNVYNLISRVVAHLWGEEYKLRSEI